MSKNIGYKITKKRIEKGFSQQELAHKCGFDKSYLSKLENGKIENLQNKTKLKLSQVLDVPPNFFDDTNEISNNLIKTELDLSQLDDNIFGKLVKYSKQKNISLTQAAHEIIQSYLADQDENNH